MKNKNSLLTKIIATLGPASSDLNSIIRLIEKGVTVFRVNFSHGSFEMWDNLIATVRLAEKETDCHIGILGDLSGPKIRMGKIIDEGVFLQNGQDIYFTKKKIIGGSEGNEEIFPTTFPRFIDEVKPGERILLDDGNLLLKCLKRIGKGESATLNCEVVIGGLISSSKGINLPESDLSVDALTPKDIECVEYAVQKEVDYLALSFVRHADDIRLLKQHLQTFIKKHSQDNQNKKFLQDDFIEAERGMLIPIISKIEKPQAIDNLEEIIEETDGVMVARGDLGVEMALEEVAILQKQIVHMCQQHGKPVIVATQMLQSMIDAPVPTRAEVSDVANAILDGVDAVMLSGETAVGKYPVASVEMMQRIADKTNSYIKSNTLHIGTPIIKADLSKDSAAIAMGVKTIAREIKPAFLVVWTSGEGSAVYLSQQRLPIPILAFTSNVRHLRRLSLLYGVKAMYLDHPKSGSHFIRQVDEILIKEFGRQKGEPIIVVSGDPINKQGAANRIVTHFLGEMM